MPHQVPHGEVSRAGPDQLVTRYEDVRTVLTDPRFVPVERQPAEHELDVTRLRSSAESTADAFVDRFLGRGGPVDIAAEYARSLPGAVLCEIADIPAADRPRVTTWLRALTSPDRGSSRTAEYSTLVSAYVAGLAPRAPSEDALLNSLTVKCRATSVCLVSAVCALLTNLDQLDRLWVEPGLIAPAVEELLRFTPLPSVERQARDEVSLSIGKVPAGGHVLADVATANRDPTVFDRPDHLDLTRSPNPHLALAELRPSDAAAVRTMVEVGIIALARRLPGLRLAVPPDQVAWPPRVLPVTW